MDAKEISVKRFDKSARGYRPEEVDAYLKEVALTVSELTAQNSELQSKLEILAAKVEEYRRDEDSMKEALIGAQKLGNSVVAEARAKAEEIVAEAQTKGDNIIRESTESSQKTLASVKRDIEKEQHVLLLTKREVSNFKSKMLALYRTHLDAITAIPELKEEEIESVENTLSSQMAEGEPEAPEKPVEEPTKEIPDAKPEETVVETAEAPEEKKAEPELFAGRFVSPVSEERRSGESRFGDLRFGRNNK